MVIGVALRAGQVAVRGLPKCVGVDAGRDPFRLAKLHREHHDRAVVVTAETALVGVLRRRRAYICHRHKENCTQPHAAAPDLHANRFFDVVALVLRQSE